MITYPANREVPDRVARGIMLLDERGPENWREMIDIVSLDIANPDDCILGQLYDSYHAGCAALFHGEPHIYDAATPCGFNYSEADPQYVTREWIKQMFQTPAVQQEQPRLELTPHLLQQLSQLSTELHDETRPLAVCELDMQGVRVVLK